MFVVIFEVTAKPDRQKTYFDLAAELRPELERVDGFLSVERFESVAAPGKFVSLSFWRDAASIDRWRAHDGHRLAQGRGKAEIFADYKISVAEITRQYTLSERAAEDA